MLFEVFGRISNLEQATMTSTNGFLRSEKPKKALITGITGQVSTKYLCFKTLKLHSSCFSGLGSTLVLVSLKPVLPWNSLHRLQQFFSAVAIVHQVPMLTLVSKQTIHYPILFSNCICRTVPTWLSFCWRRATRCMASSAEPLV